MFQLRTKLTLLFWRFITLLHTFVPVSDPNEPPNCNADLEQQRNEHVASSVVLAAGQWPIPATYISLPRHPSASPESLLTSSLVDTLTNTTKVGFELQHIGAYFDTLPRRIGTNAALDASIDCMLHGHKSLLRQ